MNLESGILTLTSLSLLFSFVVAAVVVVVIFDYTEENIVSTGVRNTKKQKAESKENPQSSKLKKSERFLSVLLMFLHIIFGKQ